MAGVQDSLQHRRLELRRRVERTEDSTTGLSPDAPRSPTSRTTIFLRGCRLLLGRSGAPDDHSCGDARWTRANSGSR